MFLPLSDTPNPHGRSYVTWALIAVNVAVFALITWPAGRTEVDLHDPLLLDYLRVLGVQGSVSAQEVLTHVSARELQVFRYGFRPAEFSLLTLVTSLFLHGGIGHLAGNMLFLYIFGDNVEYRLGRVRFLLIYLVCGFAATLFYAAFAHGSQVPLIGASGAIFGVLGLYFLWFPRNKVKIFVFLFPFIMTSIHLPARLILGIYLVVDNILPFVLTQNNSSGVAHGAHIGGFLAGLLIAWGANSVWPRDWRKKGPQGDANQTPQEFQGGLAPVQISAGFAEGDRLNAVESYLHLKEKAQRLQVDDQAVLQIAAFLQENRRSLEALSVYRRFIADRPQAHDLDQAYLGAGRSMLSSPRHTTSAYHYFLAAHDAARSESLKAEAKAYLRRIEVG